MQAMRARGANPIGRSQGGGVSRKPRFWGSREQRMRHVACMRHDIMTFHAQDYTYNYALEAITASFGRIYGMRHGMRRQGQFHHGWRPKTPFSGKLSARRPEKVFRYLHNHWI